MSKQAVINILNKTNISAWARNYWNGVLKHLKRQEKELTQLNADWDQAEEWLKDDNWGHNE
jgi:hypothetical protein|tara:strand:- start:444 stop:626 length:183 start_codon:yes stop_codon:yes gene_type:complete